MKPARAVVTRSPHRSVGVVHAPWFQGAGIEHESDLEKSCVEILLVTPLVIRIEHQPLVIQYQVDGKWREHFPDYRVTLRDNSTVIIEVKPEKFVVQHHSKFDACASLLQATDINYFVCTEKSLDLSRVTMAEELRQHARMAVSADELQALMEWVRAQTRVTVEAAVARGFDVKLLGHAVGRRLLTAGPDLDLSPKKWLIPTETVDEHLCIDPWLGCSPWGAHASP